MNKKLKIFLNIILVLVLISSLIWGYLARNLNCWFETSCGLDETGYWPVVFLLVVPLLIIFVIVIINKKK
jgi:hypothetical protein